MPHHAAEGGVAARPVGDALAHPRLRTRRALARLVRLHERRFPRDDQATDLVGDRPPWTDRLSPYERMRIVMEAETFLPTAYEGHVGGRPVGFQRRRSGVAQVEVAGNLVFAVSSTGIGMAFRRESGRLVTFLNESGDQVIRSLFLNPFHQQGPCVILISIHVSDSFRNLWISSLALGDISRGKLPRPVPIAATEDLSGTGFAEFDVHNRTLLTLTAGRPSGPPRTLRVRSLVDYGVRLSYCGDSSIEDVKSSPGMLWVFRVRDGRRIPVVLIDASTFEPVAYLRIDAATEGPISFIEATSSNILVQAPNRALVITQSCRVAKKPPTGESPVATRTRSRTRGAPEGGPGDDSPVFLVTTRHGGSRRGRPAGSAPEAVERRPFRLADLPVFRAGASTQRRVSRFTPPRLFNFLFPQRSFLACYEDRIDVWRENGSLVRSLPIHLSQQGSLVELVAVGPPMWGIFVCCHHASPTSPAVLFAVDVGATAGDAAGGRPPSGGPAAMRSSPWLRAIGEQPMNRAREIHARHDLVAIAVDREAPYSIVTGSKGGEIFAWGLERVSA